MDAHGVYAGGHNWDEAQAAMNEDGCIKGIYGNIEKDFEVGGKASVGSLEVQNNAKVNGDLYVEGNGTITKDMVVGNDMTVHGASDMHGNVHMYKDLQVDGNTNLKGNLQVDGDHTVMGNSTINGNQTVNKDFAVGGNSTFNGDVNMNQNLSVAGNATVGGTLTADQIIVGGKNINGEINRLDSRIDKVGAQSAALAGLRPAPFDADNVWSFAAAYGNYAGENAGAVGLFYRPNEKVSLGLSSTIGDHNNMMNVGVSVALNKGKNAGLTKTALAGQVTALKQDNAVLHSENEKMKQAIIMLSNQLQELSNNANR